MAPRYLLYDIESAPNLAYVWGKWDQDVVAFEREWFVLCFAYQWLDEGVTRVVALPDFKRAYRKDPYNDYHVLAELHKLFNEADAVIGHNSQRFDNRKVNARWLYHGFDPPSPFRSVDTCQIAKRQFGFTSNKLGELCEHLGIGAKEDTHGFQTWLGCMMGDQESWDRMTKYNIQDVELLRELFLRLRPWADGLPNMALLTGELDNCPRCGSTDLTRQGYKYNRTSTMQQYRCGSCGGWCSSRLSERGEKPSLVS